MRPRLKFVLAVFILFGVGLLLLPSKKYPAKKEAWMEAAIPETLPGYTLVSSSLRGTKMDRQTYDILQPFGIVVRQYQDRDGRTFDFTVIAGNTRKPFHDPQICFTAQNWYLINPRQRELNIPTLGGKIPATVMPIERINQAGARGLAVYFYKDPIAWRHSPLYVPFDLTAAKLMMRESADAQFYRFMLMPATTPRDQSAAALEETVSIDLRRVEKFADAVFAQLAKTEDGRYFASPPQ